jgi:hypothetical protein
MFSFLTKSMTCFIWNNDDDLIVEAPIDKDNRLYYVDLPSLLLENLTPSGGCTARMWAQDSALSVSCQPFRLLSHFSRRCRRMLSLAFANTDRLPTRK